MTVSRKKNRVKALVAEDHLRMRARIVEILEKEFYVMTAVADGDELIHAARVLHPRRNDAQTQRAHGQGAACRVRCRHPLCVSYHQLPCRAADVA